MICARAPGEGKTSSVAVPTAAICNCINHYSFRHLQRICSKYSPEG
jgi:hypothetical protein